MLFDQFRLFERLGNRSTSRLTRDETGDAGCLSFVTLSARRPGSRTRTGSNRHRRIDRWSIRGTPPALPLALGQELGRARERAGAVTCCMLPTRLSQERGRCQKLHASDDFV